MKELIAKLLKKPTRLKEKEILGIIEVPKDAKLGDFSFPCFTLAKTFRKNPVEIAKEIVSSLKNSLEFEKVEAIGGYVNFFANRTIIAEETLNDIQKKRDKYGSSNLGKGKKILVEFSSPNVAKPFGLHHLRSTIIGNSIANISEFSGFNVTRMNYLGDWGTQFGKLILGYRKFGNPENLKKDPIKHLLDIYIKVSADENLEPEAREAFKKLEYGDKEAFELWRLFRKLSLDNFQDVYGILGIKFDVIDGESNYNKKMESVVKELKKKNVLVESEGALIVDLREYDLGVCIIQKSDGATIYATRDIAAAIERKKKYNFDFMFYEVGSEQNLHFRQVFKILELLGHKWAKNCTHIAHGMYLGKDGKKFSTRKGKMLFMSDILNETDLLARDELKKRCKLSEKELEARSRAISNAAIIYGDLKNHHASDMVFDIERFTSFEGDTGPYLLYSYARARSILEKAKYKNKKYSIHNLNDSEKSLISILSNFPEVVKESYNSLSPNLIANYALQLSQTFNEFYHSNQVIRSENEQFRLVLVDSFSQVLKNSLSLLGIPVIEKM